MARELLTSLRSEVVDLDQPAGERTLREWIEWAEQRIVDADPANHGAKAVFDVIASVNEWNHRED